MGPASRRNLSDMNPRQRRGILLLTFAALGLLGVFVLVAGYVADVREEVEPKITVLALAKDAEKDKAITDDMVKEVELPRQWAPKTALRDRARLIGQVATADAPAESILQEGMLGPPPELATGEREIAILVDAETGVAGKIQPGADVDVIALSFSTGLSSASTRTFGSTSARTSATYPATRTNTPSRPKAERVSKRMPRRCRGFMAPRLRRKPGPKGGPDKC